MTNLYNPGPEYGPSSGYGPRNPSQAGASKFHYGNDYRAPLGTPIRAAADGKVWYTGAASGYGNVVILKHKGADGAPYFTVYGHMNELPDLTKGQPVDAGQEIGKVGNKGISSGPHLHFETVDGDTKFNNKINGSGTGVEGWVNRVNPNTFDFHGNKVYNGAGNSIASPAQPSTAPPSNSPARATQPSPAGNSPTRAPISPNAPPQTVYDSWNPFDPAPMNPGSIGPFSTGGRILSGHQPLYPTESFVPASPGPFADHYSKWGTVPLPNAPAASDDPANFAGRFGSWASSPASALGDFNRPPSQPVPNQGKRSDVPGGVTPDATQATPVNWAFPSQGPAGLGGVLKYSNMVPSGTTQALPLADPNALASPAPDIASGDNAQAPRLVRRLVNLSAPATGSPSLAPDAQNPFDNGNDAFGAATSSGANAPSSQPLLGIVSGKPMPNYPVWPSIFQTKDQQNDQSAGDINELVQRWLRWVNA